MDRQDVIKDFDVVRSAIEETIQSLMDSGWSVNYIEENLGKALFSLTRIEKAYSENTKEK